MTYLLVEALRPTTQALPRTIFQSRASGSKAPHSKQGRQHLNTICSFSFRSSIRTNLLTSRLPFLPKPASRNEPVRSGACITMANALMKKIPSSSLYVSRPTWWLESRFHFSFAEYFNPANQEFGVLRVLNDDLVQPNAGFGTHPHRDMEIITYVVDGQLTHKDNMGTSETLGRGCVQYMSAGTGVTHSEMNQSNDLQRFLQIWVKPNARGLKPNYGSRRFSKSDRHNKLQQVVTSYARYGSDKDGGSGLIPVNQDVNIFVSELDGVTNPSVVTRGLDYTLLKNRQMYLVCIEGDLTVTSKDNYLKEALNARDAIEVAAPRDGDMSLRFNPNSSSGAHILFLEMARTI